MIVEGGGQQMSSNKDGEQLVSLDKESAGGEQRKCEAQVTPDKSSSMDDHKVHDSKPLLVSALSSKLRNAASELSKVGLNQESDQFRSIFNDAVRNRFVVTVVGEFSRGKSTFINKLLGREILPSDNLPTTALLTRITFAPKEQEGIEHLDDDNKVLKSSSEFSPSAWDGLVADNFGSNDPKGSAVVKICNEWLNKYNIELIDSPGAGDLDTERSNKVVNALMESDGAIIAVSADQALSLSEKLFIEQRVVSRRIPFLMMIVTKLDLIKLEERNNVIKYIINRLKLWKLENTISLYIANDIELTDNTYDSIKGIDKIKSAVAAWVEHPERAQLIETWIKARAGEVISVSKKMIQEQIKLLDADDERAQDVIEEKKLVLSKSEVYWSNLCLEMSKRRSNCFEKFCNFTDEGIEKIIERLQYEAVNAQNPKKWWDDNYRYRLKVELSGLNGSLAKLISQIALNDVGWLNQELQKAFKVSISSNAVTDTADDRIDVRSESNLELEDIDEKVNSVRVKSLAFGAAGSLALWAFGLSMLPIGMTMGVGVLSSIMAKKCFNSTAKEQQQLVQRAIEEDVRNVALKATEGSQDRIQKIYETILREAEDKKYGWLKSQERVIEESLKPKTQERRNILDTQFKVLQDLASQF